MSIPRTPFPLFTAVLLWTLTTLAAVPNTGTWMGTVRGDALNLSFRFQEHGQMSLTVPRSAFQGLNTEDGADTKFQLVREAGTLSFEGRFAGGEGAGHYQFTPSATYLQEMEKLGYPNISPDEQLPFALFDVGPARLKALAELGYTKLSHDMLLQVAIFQVTPEYIREMREAGYPNVTLEQLIEMRIHGIDSNYARSLSGKRKAGGR